MFDTVSRFFAEGGPFMLPIVAVFAAAGAILTERLHFYFRVCRGRPVEFVQEALSQLEQGNSTAARESLRSRSCPLVVSASHAVEAHLDGGSFAEVQNATDDAVLTESPRYTERLEYLATCANVATMTGLLGTIFGLQESFRSLALADAGQKAALLASGISQAMNTTAFGLIVAVLCMIAHARLSSRRNELVEGLDLGLTQTLRQLRARTHRTTGPQVAVAGSTAPQARNSVTGTQS